MIDLSDSTYRILVCGSRTWDDPLAVHAALFGVTATIGDHLPGVVSGMARGADTHAAEWARTFHVPLYEFHADWDTRGRAAGPIRNQQMLDYGRPHIVLAFTDDLAASKGTAHMVSIARKADLPVYVIGRAT